MRAHGRIIRDRRSIHLVWCYGKCNIPEGIQGISGRGGESSTRTTRPNLMAQLRRSIEEVKGKHQLGALPLRAACTPSSDLRSTNVYHCDDNNPK